MSSGSFRKVGSGRFWKVPESSGACWCRFQRQGSEGSGGFRRVPARVGVGSGGRVQKISIDSGEFRCGLLPRNLDRSSHVDHGDNIVHMGKTTAQKGANVVKDGVRHKDVYATAVGDITKAYFFQDRRMG